MSVTHNPSIIKDGLLLSVDFANRKSYTPGENLFVYSEILTDNIYSKQISDIITTNATLAPDNTMTADLFTANTPVTSPAPFIYQSYNTNVPTYYTFSCFVKNQSQNNVTIQLGTNRYQTQTSNGAFYFRTLFNTDTKLFTIPTYIANNQVTNISSNNFTYGYTEYPNSWIRLYMTVNMLAANSANTTGVSAAIFVGNLSNTLASNNTGIYTWGWQLEQANTVGVYVSTGAVNSPKSNVVIDQIQNLSFNIQNPEYISFANNTIEFNRTPNTSIKLGSTIKVITSNKLLPQNFLYNDHTWEIWVKINDINPGSYDVNEQNSVIAAYSGSHAGFIFSQGLLNYIIWNNASPPAISVVCNSLTVGLSGKNINQGNWYQIVVVSLNNTFTTYVNGIQIGNKNTAVISNINTPTSSYLCIGSTVSPNYTQYAKITFSNMKMYNIALTDKQVKQNFNALRKRFNL